MRTFLTRAAGAAGIAYMAMHMTYGGAQYADFGVAQVSVEPLLKWVPTIAAVAVPFIMSKWPAAAGVMKLLMDLWKYQSPEKADMLAKASALEVFAKDSGNDAMRTAAMAIRAELTK